MRPFVVGLGAVFTLLSTTPASAQEQLFPRCLKLDVVEWEWMATAAEPEPTYDPATGLVPSVIQILDEEGIGLFSRPEPGTYRVDVAAGSDTTAIRMATVSGDSLSVALTNGWSGLSMTLRPWPADSLGGAFREVSDFIGPGRWGGQLMARTIRCPRQGVL